ncbi:MAG TPA: VanW family protein [Syntrophomonadaceae bacterium]|nr:VanW family protein [Syntrophomonadaceae bacterium]
MKFKNIFLIASLVLLTLFYFGGEVFAAESSVVLPAKDYVFNIGGQESTAKLFINDSEYSMISSTELAKIFPFSIEWSHNNHIFLIEEDKYWCFTTNMLTVFTESQINTLETPPILIDNDMYIPLRFIVEELGYFITYCPNHRTYYLSTSLAELNDLSCDKCASQEELIPPVNLPVWGNLHDINDFSVLYEKSHLLGGYYTSLTNSSISRTNNIELATKAIDNMIISPGKTFSFNKAVGQRTTSKGYQAAPIFVGKKVVPGLGGGICQVSSTLYNMALNANLPVLERSPHSLKVAYVPPNLDASVAWGAIDFKFQNNYEYPVRLMAKVVGEYVVTGVFRE